MLETGGLFGTMAYYEMGLVASLRILTQQGLSLTLGSGEIRTRSSWLPSTNATSALEMLLSKVDGFLVATTI